MTSFCLSLFVELSETSPNSCFCFFKNLITIAILYWVFFRVVVQVLAVGNTCSFELRGTAHAATADLEVKD